MCLAVEDKTERRDTKEETEETEDTETEKMEVAVHHQVGLCHVFYCFVTCYCMSSFLEGSFSK